jgi:hypothetical protein
MSTLPPWATGPFELILHAEEHLRKGEDFDRRIALISFDNSIEVSITTYLSLNPIHRKNRTYKKDDVDKWLNNYHTKLDFLDEELKSRNLSWKIDKTHIIWTHEHRNEQYHSGSKGTPEKKVLSIIKESALWIFGFLFDVQDVEKNLEDEISARIPQPLPQPDKELDRAIDSVYGMVQVGEQEYYTSELLFNTDLSAYYDIGETLKQWQSPEGEVEQKI